MQVRYLEYSIGITFCLAAVLLFFNSESDQKRVERITGVKLMSSSSSALSFDEAVWWRYESRELEFSIWLPKTIWPEKIPVKVRYSPKEDAVYIGPSSNIWVIKRYPVQEDRDTYNFAKKLGPDCFIQNFPWNASKLVSFEISVPDGDITTVRCPARSSAWVFFYSPEKHAIYYWDIGQEIYFHGESSNDAYEGLMVKSFQLL